MTRRQEGSQQPAGITGVSCRRRVNSAAVDITVIPTLLSHFHHG
jgi:hypothetical protein